MIYHSEAVLLAAFQDFMAFFELKYPELGSIEGSELENLLLFAFDHGAAFAYTDVVEKV